MEEPHGKRIEGTHTVPTNDIEGGKSQEPIVTAKFMVMKNVPQKESKTNRNIIINMFCLAILVISVFSFFHFFMENNQVDDSRYLKKDIYNEKYGDGTMGASLYDGGKMRKCSDYNNGCCEIYHSCSVKGNNLEYDQIQISPYRILSSDKNNSNCPNLMHILTDYKGKHKAKHDCSNTKYGCCMMDFSCDRSVRLITLYPQERGAIINSLQTDEKYNMRMLSLNIVKKDINGTNCPGIGDIIKNYEHQSTKHRIAFMMMILVSIIVFSIIRCIQSCCNFVFCKNSV